MLGWHHESTLAFKRISNMQGGKPHEEDQGLAKNDDQAFELGYRCGTYY